MMIFDIRFDTRYERVAVIGALRAAIPMTIKEASAIADSGRVVVSDETGAAWVNQSNPYFSFVTSLSQAHMVPELIHGIVAKEASDKPQPSPTLPAWCEATIARLAGGLAVLANRLAKQSSRKGSTTDLANILVDMVNTIIDEHNLTPIHPHAAWTFEE